MAKPVPTTDFIASHKTGTLSSSLSKADIDRILGFEANQGESGDGKVTVGWDFKIGDEEFAIWDYKGARWSTYGSSSALTELFGDHYRPYRIG